MTGPKDIVIAALTVILIALSITLAFKDSKVKNLKKDVELLETRERIYKTELEDCAVTISDLQASINLQNEASAIASEIGQEAQRAQERADILANRLILSESRISELIRDNENFNRLAQSLDTCETYEAVLISISGGSQ